MKRCTTIPYICTVREIIFTSISSTVFTSPESTSSDLMKKKKMATNEVHHDLENSSENATEKESSKKDKKQDHSNTVTNDSFENEFHDAVDDFPIDNDLIENEGRIY